MNAARAVADELSSTHKQAENSNHACEVHPHVRRTKRRRLEEEDDGYFSRSHSPLTRAGPALTQQRGRHGVDFAPLPWTRQPQSALRPGLTLTFMMDVVRGRGRGLP
ncbi:hypothetical protein C8J57DRAFT_1509284 [Mycena rebaudengoi]|nr:hypothetical protein C8J57DRAFT_1509284 [Mycena rebaudengoi]